MTPETDAPPALTPDQRDALEVARGLAAAGIPIFVAAPDPNTQTGFALPSAWQQTAPDPSVVDRWRPGMALCAVMGQGLDLIDVDPRNGGDAAAMNGSTPVCYGVALTPSGGMHSFIRSIGSGSRDNVFPGIDIKSGTPEGEGRGFAFLAPTVRTSKVTGEPAAYRWAKAPDLQLLAQGGDTSGERLAARIRELKANSGAVRHVSGPDFWREFLASKEPSSAPAAERAIHEKLADVENFDTAAGAGFRQVLMRASMTLGGYVGGGYLDEGDAQARLEAAVSSVFGSPDEEDLRWIAQGLADGAQYPFYVYTAADELAFSEVAQAAGRAQGTDGEPPWNVYHALGVDAFDPHGDESDQGLAEAVAQRMYPVLRYGVDSNTWLVRGREMWKSREDMSGWALATVARLMPLGTTPVPRELTERTDDHWRAARRAKFMDSGGAGKVERKLRAIVRNVDHPAGIEVGTLDTDPEVLWAGGLAWDLRASLEVPTLAEIDPATPHLHTARCAPAVVPTPAWDAFVAAVWPDAELRAWALRVLSIALAGYPDAALPVLYGPERTGKTSLVQLVVKVLGSYGHAADPRLLGGADNAHASVVYDLKGRRLSFIDEGPRRGHLAAERLKQLTGGGQLTGNAMRANPVTFEPTHTLVMTTNDEPPVTDPALRARMRVIPCESDKGLVRAARQALTPAVWHAEAPGVLAALMRETAAWLLDPDSAGTERAPVAVQGAVEEMASAQNPVKEWVELCTVPADPGTPGRELYTAFARWHSDSPLHRRAALPSETAFGRTLNEMGYPSTQHGTGRDRRWYRPLSVLGGRAGVAPWEPLPSHHMTPGTRTVEAGLGGSGAGSEPQPAQPDTARSTPVSSIEWAGWAGSQRSMTHTSTHITPNGVTEEKVQGNTEQLANPPASAPQTGFDLGCQGSASTRPDPTTMTPGRVAGEINSEIPSVSAVSNSVLDVGADATRDATCGNEDHVDDLASKVPNPSVSSLKVTNSEVAAKAAADKISKAEARAAIKAEQRRAAIAEAGGEVLALPAVVDRAGNTLALTPPQAAAVVRNCLAQSGALTVDVETSGYPVGHADYALRSVQLGDATAAVVFDPLAHAELITSLLAEAPKLHAHSATADLVPLAHAGLLDAEAGWDRMYDTVIPAKLADPAMTDSDPGLKKLAGAMLGSDSVAPASDEARAALFKAGRWLTDTKVTTPVEKSGWAQVQTGASVMVRYAASDVLDTAALARALPQPDPAVTERERVAQRMTARVAHRGLRIDAEHVAHKLALHTAERAVAAERVRVFDIENPGSNPQVGAALLAMGAQLPRSQKTGAPSVAVGVLEPMRKAEGQIGELVNAVLDYRHHDTVLGTFLEPYRQLCERGDGRARPTVYTLGTDTGRMSCVRPNLQQLPREGGVRACITADPGQLLISADFSGVEIRVAAALSQDPTLLQIIAEGRDLHGEVARQVWGPEATDADRYTAKRIVFGRLYGGGVPALAAQAGVSQSITASAIDTLDALTPVLSDWSRSVRDATKQGYTQFRTYAGRIIHLPRDYPHKAPNYAIQGTARELLVDALLRWRDTRWGSCVLLPVHDELDVAVPEEDAEEATAELVRCMQTELMGVAIKVKPSKPSFAWADST